MGEQQLKRKLTAEEIHKLKPSIAKKCENISKEDIVKEIYNLEKSRIEQQKGHMNFRDKLNLREEISCKTNQPIKYTSNSNDLAKVVANYFTDIHFKDIKKKHPNLNLEKPSMIEKKRNLRNSYINDNFHYKAPLSLSDKLKRWTALGLVGATAIGIIGHEVLFKDQNINTPEETTITETTQPQISTPKEYLESQLEDSTLLTHFKEVVANELNDKFNYNLSSNNFSITSKNHTFIYKLTNKAGEVFYITKGDSPAYVEKLLPQSGYTCERVAANNNGSKVITLDGGEIYINCAENENSDIVAIDASGWKFTNHAPSEQEIKSGYSNILNSKSKEPAQLLADICSTGMFNAVCYSNKDNYIESLLEYIEKHPESKLSKEVNSAIKEAQTIESKTNNATIEIEDNEFEL